MDTTLLNLIAVLYGDIIKLDKEKLHNAISDEKSDFLERNAKEIICSINPENNSQIDGELCVNSQGYYDIINCCREQNDFLLYRSVLCQLDSLIDMDALISNHDYNKYYNENSHRPFNSLNTNCEESGITIIPNVPCLANTFYVYNGSSTEDKDGKDGYYWYDNINDHFNNVICIQNSILDGYTINNVIVDFFMNRERDRIVIGATPCCNVPLNELMDKYQYCNKETGLQHFKIKKYYDPSFHTNRFLQVLNLAKNKNVDILMGTEMLGSLELCEPSEDGFNQLFRDQSGQAPHLIVTPSLWQNGKNYISVYLNSGELLGKQYKQHSFEYSDNGERYEEDLENTPKEILLIHVPGWGRISFPICVDLLVAKYRDLLVRDLKSNLILCPSYSEGVVQFGNANGTIRDFGARLVWLNSCSALRKFTDNPEDIGIVAVPITSPYDLEASAKIIHPKCEGNCLDACMFIVNIQVKSNREKHCNDVEIIHVPFD